MSSWSARVRNPCIVCGEREGTIHTMDGTVCNRCMPKELLNDAEDIGLYQIRAYHRSHRDERWANCETVLSSEYDEKKVSDDRSMVITTFDPVILKDELCREIETAESIDIVVSFILCSGLNDIIESLRRFTRKGKLRIMTTTYMGTTEYEALVQLITLDNTEVKIELSSGEKRLHAKAFLFNRPGGTSTAYVGSANLSHSALTTGEEWEVKIREQDLKEAVDDVRRSFESMWESPLYVRVTRTNLGLIEEAIEKGKKGRR